MLKDDSVQVSPDLTTATSQFNNAGLTSLIQTAMQSTNPAVRASLELLPSVLSGMPAPGAGDTGTATNLIDAIKAQADSLVAGGAKGFASVFGQTSSHAATSFSFSGALAQAQGKSFEDFGFAFSNYDDILSGGVSNQFVVSSLPKLASELPNFGTMFSTADLYNMTNPGSVAANLIDQGLGAVGNFAAMLEEEGCDMENLVDENPTVILDVMRRITGSDLTEILTTTNFMPPPNARIGTLADIFEISNILTPEAQSALGSSPTVSDLSRKFSNIGGRFKDIAALGTLYSSLELKSFPRLKELGALVPSDMELDLSSTLGKGSGELGNPTLSDMMGSVAGVGYTDNIKQLAEAQADLLGNSPDVQALANYLSAHPTNPDPAVLDTLINNINSKPELVETLNKAKAASIDITERLATEKSNIDVASINTTATSSTQGLVSMAGNLHGYGVDPMSLGMGSIIEGSAKDNVYGDATKASLIEGRNLGRLAVFGIKPGTKMDAMDYANSLKGIAL